MLGRRKKAPTRNPGTCGQGTVRLTTHFGVSPLAYEGRSSLKYLPDEFRREMWAERQPMPNFDDVSNPMSYLGSNAVFSCPRTEEIGQDLEVPSTANRLVTVGNASRIAGAIAAQNLCATCPYFGMSTAEITDKQQQNGAARVAVLELALQEARLRQALAEVTAATHILNQQALPAPDQTI